MFSGPGRQLHAFSRQARTLNSLNRFYSTESRVDTTLQTRIKERSAEIESRYQSDAVPERISRRRAEQLAWKARGERSKPSQFYNSQGQPSLKNIN